MDAPARTPVPPPAPVLPDAGSSLPPASGRRFSANEEPAEYARSAPRRSAVSPASPIAIEQRPAASWPSRPPREPAPPAPRFTPSPYAPSPAAGPSDKPPTAETTVALRPFTAPSATVDSALAGAALIVPATTPTPAAAEEATERATVPARKRRRFGRKPKDEAAAPAHEQVPTAEPVRSAPAPEVSTPAAAAVESGEAPPQDDDAPRNSRCSARPAVMVIAAVVVVALVVAVGVSLLTLKSVAPSTAPSLPITDSPLDPLVTTDDLGSLGGVTWTAASGTADAVRPLCLPEAGTGVPESLRTVSRGTTASDDEAAAFVQVIDTYADDATATRAFEARTSQLANCADDIAWITGANSVSGLADAAISERLVVQSESGDQFHTLLISRTGRSVSLAEVTTTDSAVNALDLASAVGQALTRQCGADLGTCPTSIEVGTIPPLAGSPAGWLVAADLPRVTPGAGRWGATDPKTTLDVIGSQCEAMDLQAVADTEMAAQRTLLLADDTSAPQGFGIDMVTYTLARAKKATALGEELVSNITKCENRAPTATVEEGSLANGTGQDGEKFTGDTFLVTQKTETTTVVYRVGVLVVDNQVIYLLANPTTDFDFTDAQWKAVAVRAGQRASQG